MQRREPFGQLRAEQGEGWHAAEGRQMTWPGIVSDEKTGAGNQREQLAHGVRAANIFFPGLQPPVLLVRIAGKLDAIIFVTEPADQIAVAVQRPHAHRLAGAGVHEDFAAGGEPGDRKFFTCRQFEAQSL